MTGARSKVLLVDDDPLMHWLYQPHIERAGYDLLTAADGIEGTQLAESELPQFVVMDLVMPGGDGVKAIIELKRTERTRRIPIIAISGDLEYHRLRKEVISLGAECFLTKPFSPKQLICEIHRLEGTPD